jgi:predicted Zn-dependent peptidase
MTMKLVRMLRLAGSAAVLFGLLTGPVVTSTAKDAPKVTTQKSKDGKYTYSTVAGDPLKARIYKLQNGLTVYMTVNRNEPRIQTYVAVRAGSKHDPADATGLAHYLEHMLFKGTDKYGSLDYSKEKPLLDQIEQLYETYRRTTDDNARKAIYRTIDSVSGVAANFAIANEFDKMISALGAKGTNAYTSNERTVYVNDIPSNQLKRWIAIESERYRNPVLRLFHTELEAVYEEKNRALDNDPRTVTETLLSELFKNHPYGTQTTIGTVEHLKNPSITKIKEYYNKYYVPNNMAICLSGDFDPDQAIVMIDQAFGYMQPKQVADLTFAPEKPITSPIRREVFGPDAEMVQFGFRFPGIGTHDADVITMVDMILSNAQAGLIDLNLNKAQKVLNASCGPWLLKDYGIHMFTGRPLAGQSLEDVEKLMLDQIELVKKGQFDEKILKAIINDLTIQQIRSFESNSGRADAFVEAFTTYQNWEDHVAHLDKLSKITKDEIVKAANKYYNNNYVVVYKRTGDRRDVVKVEKPAITPVTVNREAESPFLKTVNTMPADKISPRFVDYKSDIKETKLSSGVPVYYLKNDENELFTLYYMLDMGKRHDKELAFAVQYLPFLGTSKMSAEEVTKKLYELGCNLNVSSSEDQSYVYISGLQKNFKEAVSLFEDLLHNAKPDQTALNALVQRTLKGRADNKKNKNAILGALRTYGMFGKFNANTNILSNAQLQGLKAEQLVQKLKDLTSFEHRVLYYGPAAVGEVTSSLNTLHKTPKSLKPIPAAAMYQPQDASQNKVYFVDYDMAQAEIQWVSKLRNYDAKSIPQMELFNEYFGGSMSSIVFQNIRESKALAYSVWSAVTTPAKKEDPHFVYAYVGTQADKTPETMTAMVDIMNNMPRADANFQQAKQAIQNKIETERITRTGILFDYERAKRLGLNQDIRQAVYSSVPQMSYDDIARFQQENIKGRNYSILVLGSKSKIDRSNLEKYGPIEELTLTDIFGY